MSYRLRGEICVDVEDFQYDIEIDVNGPEGISELMSENNITTAELVEYQNEFTDDHYRPDITDYNIGEYIGSLDTDGVADLAERCVRTLNARYKAMQVDCTNLKSDIAELKLKHQPVSEPTPVASVDTSARI